jgi:UDPglucose--hexose-1-phosphate uridylyltransferase
VTEDVRRNPITGEWSAYSGKRRAVVPFGMGARPGTPSCPFCPGAGREVTPDSTVSLIPNRYPTFWATEGNQSRNYGYQDIFIYTTDHNERLVDQPPGRVAELLSVIGSRVASYYEDSRIVSAFSFEISGAMFGPSVPHTHGQNYGLTFVPPRVRPVAEGDRCLICDRSSRWRDDDLMVLETAEARLSCPPVSRFPYEMVLAPVRHVGLLSDCSASELLALASLLLTALRINLGPDGACPPYLIGYQHASRPDFERSHFRLEIAPTRTPAGGTKYLGGLEIAAGLFLNPLLPEAAAADLRDRLRLATPT